MGTKFLGPEVFARVQCPECGGTGKSEEWAAYNKRMLVWCGTLECAAQLLAASKLQRVINHPINLYCLKEEPPHCICSGSGYVEKFVPLEELLLRYALNGD